MACNIVEESREIRFDSQWFYFILFFFLFYFYKPLYFYLLFLNYWSLTHNYDCHFFSYINRLRHENIIPTLLILKIRIHQLAFHKQAISPGSVIQQERITLSIIRVLSHKYLHAWKDLNDFSMLIDCWYWRKYRRKIKTYIWRYTSSVVVSIPVKCAYSVQLLNTHDLMQNNCGNKE
jgi:hypothetical protein